MLKKIEPAAGTDRLSGRPVPRLVGVSTAVPEKAYSQEEVLSLFSIENRQIRSVFVNGGISQRHLSLNTLADSGRIAPETQSGLLEKHLRVGLDIGARALDDCLNSIGAQRSDVRHLCCVSSTGFIIPGFSALFISELGLPVDCSRVDIVGMGCNAGLNALNAVSAWSSCHPGELAIVLCIEVCSALYVPDESMTSAVVNSLFGDGAAAAALMSLPHCHDAGPGLIDFRSHVIPETKDAMRLRWHDAHGKFSFELEPEVPYVVGANISKPVNALLRSAGLTTSDVSHWVIHSGGRKVIDAVRVNLGLTRHDVRHTLGVLKDHGNLSSGSFLFSYQRLISEGSVSAGDNGVMITMGPGSTIETALLSW